MTEDQIILFSQEDVLAYQIAIKAEAAATEASNAANKVNESYLLA